MAIGKLQRFSMMQQGLAVVGGFAVLWLGWGLLSSGLTTASVYNTLEHAQGYQVRRYDFQLVARVHVSGPWRQASEQGAQILQDYLSGNNIVASGSAQSTHIALSAARIIQEDGDGWVVSVPLPASYTQETVPRPNDPRVSIRELPERVVAVLGFRGWADPSVNESRRAQLTELIVRDRHTVAGTAMVVQYSGSWVPGPFRRNEILIPIR